MADNTNSRDKQTAAEERRQRERELQEARDRVDEPEPINAESTDQRGDLDEALETHNHPMTTDELIRAHGDREVETQMGRNPLKRYLLRSATNRTNPLTMFEIEYRESYLANWVSLMLVRATTESASHGL